MNNNDTLRSLRYTFDLNDSKMMSIFEMGGSEVTREQVSQWLKKDEDPDFKSLNGAELAAFLNGFIVKNRGAKEGAETPVPEKWMTNNLILKKIKIALNLKSEDVMALLKLVNVELSDHELSALFRKPEHKNYRTCQDQFLRSFLKALQLKHRPAVTA